MKKCFIKDTLKAFDNFKNKQKSVKVIFFRYVKLRKNTQMLKKFPSDKINCTKNVLFFLLRAPTHHSFTFNL